jgi:hypothetical protein
MVWILVVPNEGVPNLKGILVILFLQGFDMIMPLLWDEASKFPTGGRKNSYLQEIGFIVMLVTANSINDLVGIWWELLIYLFNQPRSQPVALETLFIGIQQISVRLKQFIPG